MRGNSHVPFFEGEAALLPPPYWTRAGGVHLIRSEASIMPAVMRIGRYRFFFYSNGGNEPHPIHVDAGEDGAKFWLLPVRLATSHGFRARDLNEIERLVIEHEAEFAEAWDDHFGRG